MIALTFQRPIQDTRSYISNPYANYYELRPGVWNFHPGIDILFQEGSIAHCPVYAVAWTQITYAERCLVPGFDVWGNLIVGRCELLNGQQVYCRYAHVENILVKEGDIVHPGQHIADVGNAYGAYVYHLDFCISPTKVLALTPWDWPGVDLARVYRDYLDPVSFIKEHSQMANDYTTLNAALSNAKSAMADLEAAIKAFETPPTPPPEPVPQNATVTNAAGANIRQSPTTSATILVTVNVNTKLTVVDSGIDADGFHWMKVTIGPAGSAGGYVARSLLSFP